MRLIYDVIVERGVLYDTSSDELKWYYLFDSDRDFEKVSDNIFAKARKFWKGRGGLHLGKRGQKSCDRGNSL